MVNNTPDDFTKHLYEELQSPEFREVYLRGAILDYAEDGNYKEFFEALEDVIKSQTTIAEFAKEINMNRVQLTRILHGKNSNPTLKNVLKILKGLGYSLEVINA